MSQGSTRTLWELLGTNTRRAATRGLAGADSCLGPGRPAQWRPPKCFGRPYAPWERLPVQDVGSETDP